MFGKLMAQIKGVLAKVGLLKEINNVTSFSAVISSEEDYDRMQIWRDLYRGYLANYAGMPYHDVNYSTVDGTRKRRQRASMNMAKVSCEKMASLVFNEKCVINISDATLSDNIEDVLKANNFNKRFQQHLEFGFALGGFVIKPFVVDGKIKISFVTAQNFFPLQTTNDEIQAGVFVNETRQGDKWYYLLEWHTWENGAYLITNELYQSTSRDNLGIKVDLGILYPNMEKQIIINNLTRPLFIYIKPNIANNFETNSPLGVSIFANSIDTLKSLDIAFDSFQREFVLGKRRILVPYSAVRTFVDPKTQELHRFFDADDEVYQSMRSQNTDPDFIKDLSVELRVEDHIKAINALLNIFAMQIGMTAGTFTFNSAQIKTATEVMSENSETFRTKSSHETLVEHGLKELVDTIVELASLYGIFTTTGEYDVNVEFDDSITQDKAQNANFYITMVASQMMPKVEAIKRIFDFTDEQAQEWVAKITAENAQPDPMGNNPPEGDLGKALLTNAEMAVKKADYESM